MADSSPHGPNVFICSFAECGQFFHKKSRLLIHLRSHTGERPYVCSHEDCVKSYARAAHLKRHIESAHVNPEDRSPKVRLSYRCPYEECGLTVKTQWNLTKHIRRRHQSQEYVCQVDDCGKRCNSTKQLKRHERIHHSIDPMICPHEGCGKVFTCDSRLKAHQKVHEGYKCQYEGCAEKATSWTLLRKHIAIAHKVLSELECRICNKKFTNKSNLKMHMMVHSENRPVFECTRENCGRVYLDKKNLTAHIRSYHDGKRVLCQHDGCSRTFSCKKRMLLHLPHHDPNRPLPKKKRRKKAACISGSEGPSKKKRKKRHRRNMAVSLLGLDGENESGAKDSISVLETDEEDKIVLSESDTEAGCKVITGWKQLLPISDIRKLVRKDKKQSQGTVTKEEKCLPDCQESKNIQGEMKHSKATVESEKKDGNKKSSVTATIASAEAELVSEVSKNLIEGPLLTQAKYGDVEVLPQCELGPKSQKGMKSLILRPEDSQLCETEETDETCQKCLISDPDCQSSLPRESSGPLVAWDIRAFSKPADAIGVDSDALSNRKITKFETTVDMKRCIILDDISGFEKCGINNKLCIPVAEEIINSKLGTDVCDSVSEQNHRVV